MRDEAGTAAGFVHAGGADGDAFFGFEGALGVVGRLATLHADGVGLGDVLGDGEELGHRFPGFAGVVLVKAGDDDPHPSLGQLIRDVNKLVVEKLALVDTDNFSVRLNFRQHFRRAANVGRLMPHL